MSFFFCFSGLVLHKLRLHVASTGVLEGRGLAKGQLVLQINGNVNIRWKHG